MPLFNNPFEDDPFVDEFTLTLWHMEQRRREKAHAARGRAISKAKGATHGEGKRLATMARLQAERSAQRAPWGRVGESHKDRILLAMRPGEWLSYRDISNRTGGTPLPVIALKLKQLLAPKGLAEQAENEDYAGKPRINVGGRFIDIEQPQWLWRLTAAGVALRAELEATVGQVKDKSGIPPRRPRWPGNGKRSERPK